MHNQMCLISHQRCAYGTKIGSDQVMPTLAGQLADNLSGHLANTPMAHLASVLQAISAFSATNIDDIFILMLLFSRLDRQFRARHVVSGQFLGIAALVVVSLAGLACRTTLPSSWIGLLGLLPISLGVSQLIERLETSAGDGGLPAEGSAATLELAGVAGVASITVANGSDNIGVYMPMFASANPTQLVTILVVFTLLTGLWCLLAWWLIRAPGLAGWLQRHGQSLMPAVLIGIGAHILRSNHTLGQPALAVLTLACLAVMVGSLGRQLHEQLSQRPIAGAHQP